MRNVIFGTLLFSLGLLVGARADEAIIAQVNGHPITLTELNQKVAQISGPYGEPLSEADQQGALDDLIADALLYEEALTRGLDQDPKVKKVMISTLLRDQVYANIRNSDFTEQQLQAYYEAHREAFVVPEKVQIKQIVIKFDHRSRQEARALIDDIRAQVIADQDAFKDLAMEHSEDPYRRRGGDVGFVSASGKPGLPARVVEVAFSQEVGAVSEIFETPNAYNIVLTADRRDRVVRTYQQMKGSVLRKVKNERLQELYLQYVDDLRGEATVKIERRTLRDLDLRYSSSSDGVRPE